MATKHTAPKKPVIPPSKTDHERDVTSGHWKDVPKKAPLPKKK